MFPFAKHVREELKLYTNESSFAGWQWAWSWLCPLSLRGTTPPICDESTASSTRWRLQYDVYQYFLPENDLSERSLFTGFQAVAKIQGIMENGKRVGTMTLE